MKSLPSKTSTTGRPRRSTMASTAALQERYWRLLNRSLMNKREELMTSSESFKVQSLRCDLEELQLILSDVIKLSKNMQIWLTVLSSSLNGLLEKGLTIGDGVGDHRRTYENSSLAYLTSLEESRAQLTVTLSSASTLISSLSQSYRTYLQCENSKRK